jgi:hypothetical protein
VVTRRFDWIAASIGRNVHLPPSLCTFLTGKRCMSRDTGYHTEPLSVDFAAAARIPLLAHRHSVVAAHGRIGAERDNNTDLRL